MKQAQLKSAFILSIIFLSFLFVAYAAVNGVNLNFPSNIWVLTNSVNFNFTVNTSSTLISYCAVYVNNSGTMDFKANYTNAINGTPHIAGIAINDSHAFNVWGWNVTCNNGTTDFTSNSTASFGVDGNIPSISLDSPANGVYLDNLNITLFKYTPTDTSNPDTCEFYTNLSGTWKSNQTNRTWASGVQISVNLSNNTQSGGHIASVIADGKYAFGATCNDTAGNGNLVFTQNRTFTVDTVIPTTPSFSIPANLNQTNATLYVEWSVITELNFDRYDAVLSPYLNMSDPTQSISVSGNTSKNFTTFSSVVDGSYFIQIRAFDLAGHSANSTVRNYILDNIVPKITLNLPSNNSFLSDRTPDFNITLNDTNVDRCVLLLSKQGDFNLTNNATTPVNGITNGTLFNITIPNNMDDGVYNFNVECNDTVNHRVNVSSTNLQTTMDNTTPSSPSIISIFHQTNSTNKIPDLLWRTVVETNFSKYQVQAKYFNNASVAYEINITSRTTNVSRLNLSAGYSYYFNVTVYDLAGNTNSSENTTIQTLYYVDSICGVLNAGWNVCGAVWTSPKSLSLIANETGANQVAVFNSSHKFATCNAAVSTTGQHCAVLTNISSPVINGTTGEGFYDTSINHAVFVFVNRTTNWNNRTWVAVKGSSNITLTNSSGIGWNIEAMFARNGRVFGHIKNTFIDGNVSMFSTPYNNGSSLPYVNNGLFKGLNNNTNIDYGRAMWMFFNGTVNNVSLANTTYNVSGW